MRVKEKHRDKLLRYLSNPDNEWLDRAGLATQVLGYRQPGSMWHAFTSEELDEIEREALDNRRKRYSRMLAHVDTAQLREAQKGNPQAAKLVYQRFEGWAEKQAHELTGPNGGPLQVEDLSETQIDARIAALEAEIQKHEGK